MQTQNAIVNLIKRYQAMLKKCNLVNNLGTLILTSGILLSLMFISDAHTVTINPSGTTVDIMDATAGRYQRPQPHSFPALNDTILKNHGTISDGREYYLPGRRAWAGMFSYDSGDRSYNFTNLGNIIANKASTDSVYGMNTFITKEFYSKPNASFEIKLPNVSVSTAMQKSSVVYLHIDYIQFQIFKPCILA